MKPNDLPQELQPGFIERTLTALNGASADLAKDNADAAAVQDKRDWAELSRIANKFGLCNVVTFLGNEAREKEDEAIGGADWAFAAEVLDAASSAVDLPYSVRNIRCEKLADFQAAVMGIRA